MKSFIAALRSLVLPFGTTSGKRIVLDSDKGIIALYDQSGNLAGTLAAATVKNGNLYSWVQGAAAYSQSAGVGVSLDEVDVVTFFSYPDSTDFTRNGVLFVNNPKKVGSLFPDAVTVLDSPASDTNEKFARLVLHPALPDGSNNPSFELIGMQNATSAIGVTVYVAGLIIPYTSTSGTSYIPETWHTMIFANSWVNDGNGEGCAYLVDACGRVHLRGWAQTGTRAEGTTVTTLPAGYVPKGQKLFRTPCPYNNTSAVTLQIDHTGAVKLFGASGLAFSNISFDQISFSLSTVG